MAENISVGGITPASDAFDALTITMTFMTELLNLVDEDGIEVGHIRLSPGLTGGRSVLPLLSSRMAIPEFDKSSKAFPVFGSPCLSKQQD
jgi:hypothetical protein